MGEVQGLLKKTYPLLVYIHCVAHRLNLVVVKSLKETCKEVLILVDKLHSLFSSAKTNDTFIKVQRENEVPVLAMPEQSEIYVLCTGCCVFTI